MLHADNVFQVLKLPLDLLLAWSHEIHSLEVLLCMHTLLLRTPAINISLSRNKLALNQPLTGRKKYLTILPTINKFLMASFQPEFPEIFFAAVARIKFLLFEGKK